MNNLLADQLQFLLSQHTIACDHEELSFQIQSHPSYPSLHSITGVLDHFNIDNIALDVPSSEETLSQLPKVFMAQLETEQGKVFAVVKNKGLVYELMFSKKEKQQLSIHDFLQQFTGIIVAVEKTEDTVMTKNNKSLVSKTLIVLASLVALAVLLTATSSVFNIAYTLISAVGLYISVAILKQELGEKTILGNAFCSNTTTKSNCDSVLTSKGANIGTYKLSDLSITYFSGITLLSFLLMITNSSLALPLVISFMALPITIYSIYYQYAIVKQWCFLCLSIVGVLWVQPVLLLLALDEIKTSIFSINSTTILLSVFVFISVFSVWNIVSPKIKDFRALKVSKIKYFKFKRDFNIFESLLNRSKTLETTIPNVSEIVLGNQNSPLVITIVTSPFCGHCKPVHQLVEQILKKHSKKVLLQIRFSVNQNNTPLVSITSRLLELYHTEGVERCLQAMHDIYGDVNSDAWINKWGKTENEPHYLNTLNQQSAWCSTNQINFTPEVLINGKSYPKEYERSELIYFIEDLHDNVHTSTTNEAVLQRTL